MDEHPKPYTDSKPGFRSHRHKDYLFQRLLAQHFPIDSFRFDFRSVLFTKLLFAVSYLHNHTLFWCLFGLPNVRLYLYQIRGNHETGGTWKQGALDEDLEDVDAVVAYLKSTYGYEIELIVGHSRGSLVAFRWIASTENGRKVPAFVNVSARYRMRVGLRFDF